MSATRHPGHPSRRVTTGGARAIALAVASGAVACGPGQSATPDRGVPSSREAAADTTAFEVLFDGTSLEAWRGYLREDVPAGWSIEEGALAFTPGIEGGDLITRGTFEDFDLRLEWKISPGGNSGIFFGVIEGPRNTYQSGPEFQVLDNRGHRDGGDPLTSAGANYGLYPPTEDATRPAGEWNEARIVRRGSHVEHWLNGVRIVEYELGSDDWKTRVAGSKFAEWPDYGVHREGHIGLQDHGDAVWYRHIRIRRLEE